MKIIIFSKKTNNFKFIKKSIKMTIIIFSETTNNFKFIKSMYIIMILDSIIELIVKYTFL